MPLKEASFWVFLTMFGTGLYFLFEPSHKIPALGLIVIGLVGMGLLVFQHHHPDAKLPSQNILAWLGLSIIWCFLGYEVVQRNGNAFTPTPGAGPYAMLLITGSVLGVLILLGIARPNRPVDGTAIKFYENRAELNNRNGGLQQELSGVRNGWVIWPAGGSSASIPIDTLAHIQRLIVRNPQKGSDIYAKHFLAGTAEIVSGAILALTHRATQLADTQVRWNTDLQNISIIISDHISDDAWARIELLLPGIESAYRPSILVTKSRQPRLFENLIKMYEYIWNESVNPNR